MNRVVLIGNLARDPELRYTSSGVAVVNFTIAVNRPFSNQQGEREADFVNVVAWRQLAENCANYLKKGRKAAVDGRLQTRSFENQEGQRIKVTEVIADNVEFLSPRSESNTQAGYNNNPFEQSSSKDPFADDGKPIDISDDDLPF
ncbi:single-stranded DNA-binding protein [Mechercharimyces sp. CAU 1602]|uniref:single-stranded DNA-binding protein n=1 Tax=Mechercharimyces sp. CAU 1602 TaxID=2973933 RepID=UPI002162D39B|nr:single-stranded DNA-binding protein [Mechercharimyces sp. CAU 1602]MCS1352673.1 single-stranded DNA-binding protein [Mechercharimyces sp. CAU 1602]